MPMTDRATMRAALLVTTTSSFLTPFMSSSVNVALPSVGRALSLDAVALGWVASSSLLSAAMFLLPFGRWADIAGRKRVFITGLLVYSAGAIGAGLAATGHLLLAARAVEGVGAAMIFGTGVAILTSAYPPGERGKVLGINVAAVYSGLALGPFLGGVLTESLGWRSVFWVVAPVALGAAALAWLKLKPEPGTREGDRFDLPGTVWYAASLAALMFGLSHLPGAVPAVLVGAGLLGLAGFVVWELRAPSPLLDVGLLVRNRVFAFSNLAALVNYSATAAAGFLLSLYLQYVKGLSPPEAGTVLLVQPVVQAALSPVAGRLSDRFEPRTIASIGMALTATGLGLLTTLSDASSPSFITWCLIVLGLGFALFSSPNTNAIMGSVEVRDYGVASATMGTMRLSGQMLSLGIVTVMLSAYVGKTQITPEHHGAFLNCAQASYTLFAILCAGGVLASRARGRVRQG